LRKNRIFCLTFLIAVIGFYTGVNFQQKIPEIEKSLELVKHLKEKMEAEEKVVTRYGLADTIYAKAELNCNGIVNLWLGANVMLEYTYDEAIELLSSKLELAKRQLDEVRNQPINFIHPFYC